MVDVPVSEPDANHERAGAGTRGRARALAGTAATQLADPQPAPTASARNGRARLPYVTNTPGIVSTRALTRHSRCPGHAASPIGHPESAPADESGRSRKSV